MSESDSESVLTHQPCSDCGSSDALSIYSDGHTFCFSCQKNTPGKEASAAVQKQRIKTDLIEGEFIALDRRGITEETCRKFDYAVAKIGPNPCQVATFRDETGTPCAQHIRYPGKAFGWIGNSAKVVLYGQHLFPGGKRIVVTEGEIDCLTVSQAFNNRWPVVSLPSGIASAEKYLKRSLEWLEGFEQIVLWFDDDEPGREGVQKVAGLFTPGRLKVVQGTGHKDANEVLLKQNAAAVTQAVFNAKPYRPDGIVDGSELFELVQRQPESGFPVHYPKLTKMLRGFQKGELYLFSAGSGIGKSTLAWEIIEYLHTKHGQRIGVMALEDPLKKAAERPMSIYLNKPLHIDRDVSPEKFKEAFNATTGSGRYFFYDHFGSSNIEGLLAKIRYMAVGIGIDWLLLDHISIVVSGLDEISDDERKTIDRLMTKLRTLISETGIGVVAIVHLRRRQQGKSYNEGAQVSLTDMRGSGSLEQLSDAVCAMERNQQDEAEKHISRIRVLKNRRVGETGEADELRYYADTGRLLPSGPVDAEDFGFQPGAIGKEDF